MQEGLASNTTLHGLNKRIKPVFPGSSAPMYLCELQRRKNGPGNNAVYIGSYMAHMS